MRQSFFITTLGCSKNLVDSEMLIHALEKLNMRQVDDPAAAEVIVVNTCGFIEASQQESINAILEAEGFKESGSCHTLVVTGCLSQRFGEELFESLPEIDVLLGTGNFMELPVILQERLCSTNDRYFAPGTPGCDYSQSNNRSLLTPRHTAYLKIAEGCSNCCSYCLIPSIRGPLRSRPKQVILAEARELLQKGVREINLIAQDTSAYGMESPAEGDLAGLLQDIASLEGLGWVRFLYSYPSRITDSLLEVIKGNDKICNYLDIPLQHVNENILKKMNREGDRSSLTELMVKIRERIPDISLRTTFIIGFPGETEREFHELLDFVETVQFDWVGVFPFSPQKDTPAADFPNPVPKKEARHRVDALMELQAGITQKRNSRWLGRSVKVLVEGKSPEIPELFTGRTEGQAPEVDGEVLIKGAQAHHVGNFAEVEISHIEDYDLVGEIKG